MKLTTTDRKAPTGLARAALVSLFLAVAVSGIAADANTVATAATNAPPPKVKHWDSVVAADVALTRGNSRSFLGTVTFNSHGKYEKNEFLLGAGAGYGDTVTKESTGAEVTTKTQDYLKGSAQWNYLFTERFYAGLKLDGLHDGIADINYRFTVSPLAGYYLIKHTNQTLAVEAGPSYIYEQLDSQSPDSYIAIRLAERYEYKFKSGARLWESLEWLDQVDKTENWIGNFELGLAAPISKALDVRVIVQDSYDNVPAPGRLKNDFKLMAGIGYKF